MKKYKEFFHILVMVFFICLNRAYPQIVTLTDYNTYQTRIFSTKGHPKSGGLNITLRVPVDWEAREGDRPHIIQNFEKGLGMGIVVCCNILVNDTISKIPLIPSLISDEEIMEEICSEEWIKEGLFPGFSVSVLGCKKTIYDGQPGCLISCILTAERAGIKITSYGLIHMFIYSKKLVIINCFVGGPASLVDINYVKQLYGVYLPIFSKIGASVVIQDKWERGILSKDNQIVKSLETELIIFLINFLITWTIGLLPPVIIRYFIVRKPLPMRSTLIIVTLLWFLNILIFVVLLKSKNKTHTVLGIIALVSCYILRAGANKYSGKV